MALSKNKIKYIRSLKDKKYRQEHGVFVAEGTKLVTDLLAASCPCRLIAALPGVLSANPDMTADEIVTADEYELQKATFLKTPPSIIGVFCLPVSDLSSVRFERRLSLVLDGVQDPGNVGTIVRVADWFGIENVICSHHTADVFSPKTVQATMGAIARVRVHYTDIVGFLRRHAHLPVYGTFLDGESIYSETLSENGFIVMGSEGKGIGDETAAVVNRKLFVPSFPTERATSESLNVAVATAVVCAEFRRKKSGF